MLDYFMAHAPASEIDGICGDNVEACAAFLGMEKSSYDGRIHYVLALSRARRIWADTMIAERSKMPRYEIPEGYKIVPIAATDKMFDAGIAVGTGIGGSPPSPRWVWDAMVAASTEY